MRSFCFISCSVCVDRQVSNRARIMSADVLIVTIKSFLHNLYFSKFEPWFASV